MPINTDPLDLPVPDSPIERIHAIARDCAYGFAQGWWQIVVFRGSTDDYDYIVLNSPPFDDARTQIQQNRFAEKWKPNVAPSFDAIVAFGYLASKGTGDYELTKKALALLQQPIGAPTVFISYKQTASSALALLVEERLRRVGIQNVFVDKLLKPGEAVDSELESRVRSAKFFVCLVGEDTLKSPSVLKEISWADEAGCTIISIWQPRVEIDDSCPKALSKRLYIKIDADGALNYERALNRLLNGMGYATY